ncbi:hypothetical protein LY76DRAFT_77081 [Colletotrichum caudatum]|nr:hypothetical protein LY76DRAFT_77081 [Colletotrichum caudatum]
MAARGVLGVGEGEANQCQVRQSRRRKGRGEMEQEPNAQSKTRQLRSRAFQGVGVGVTSAFLLPGWLDCDARTWFGRQEICRRLRAGGQEGGRERERERGGFATNDRVQEEGRRARDDGRDARSLTQDNQCVPGWRRGPTARLLGRYCDATDATGAK